MSEQNMPKELSADELNDVAGGAVKRTRLDTKQRTEVVASFNNIGDRNLTGESFVADDQFDASQDEDIITGNSPQ